MTLDEYFATGPPHERPVFEVVHAHLVSLGELHVEPVSVGIFFKVDRTVAQLRPMTKWVACGFLAPRRIEHERIARKVVPSGDRWWHVVNLRSADDVDEVVEGWLSEAYLSSVAAG